jgi:6-pyruvoyl-tetrahydropterin synthase
MSYSVTKSIDIDFAHHVHGHDGPCINIHGHTWKFELTLSREKLNPMGFVIDFSLMKRMILEPVHKLLDHGLCLWRGTLFQPEGQRIFIELGRLLTATRKSAEGSNRWLFHYELGHNGDLLINPGEGQRTLADAFDVDMGGMKCIAFPVVPTSERIAEWFATFAQSVLAKHDIEVKVTCARIYETLHPVEAIAEYRPA